MGCCGGKDLKHSFSTQASQGWATSSPKSPFSKIFDTNINFQNIHWNQQAFQILKYSLSLKATKNWKPYFQNSEIKVSSLPNSDLDLEYPVLRAEIHTKTKIKPTTLLDILHSPEQKWDVHLSHQQLIQGKYYRDFISYKVLKYFMYNGEFVDRKVIGVHGNSFVVITLPAFFQSPEKKGVCRGATVFSSLTMKYVDDQMKIQLISQTNLGSSLTKIFNRAAVGEFKKWCQQFVSRIEQENFDVYQVLKNDYV